MKVLQGWNDIRVSNWWHFLCVCELTICSIDTGSLSLRPLVYNLYWCVNTLTFTSVLLKAWNEPVVSGLGFSSAFFTSGSFNIGTAVAKVGAGFCGGFWVFWAWDIKKKNHHIECSYYTVNIIFVLQENTTSVFLLQNVTLIQYYLPFLCEIY